MRIPILSDRKAFVLSVGLKAYRPVRLGLVLFDPDKRHTHYYRRRVSLGFSDSSKAEARTLDIPMPVSPGYLHFEVYNKDDRYDLDAAFEITDLKIKPMEAPRVWASPERHRFMDFAVDFAQKAGYLKAGFYPSPNDEFLIQYLPKITDVGGNELVTPARIHRQMPRVQLSQQWIRQMSIPVRVAILSHEGCHFFQNTRSETKADLCGIKYYLDYGFPSIEAVYAATKVFGMHPDAVGEAQLSRTRDIIRFIDAYKKGKAA